MKAIDITPTWEGLMPMLVEVAANGDSTEGRKQAMSELMRLARMVDEGVPELVRALHGVLEAEESWGQTDRPHMEAVRAALARFNHIKESKQ